MPEIDLVQMKPALTAARLQSLHRGANMQIRKKT